MNTYHLKDFIKGRFIGNFNKTLHKTELFEVAVKQYTAGDSESSHYHEIATEYTIFHSGKFIMNNKIYQSGDIVEMLPGESTDFSCLEDGSCTVVKIPSIIGDKYVN